MLQRADTSQAKAGKLVVQITTVFLAYFIAGKLGQATTAIRSSNLGPVWPAYGIALAAFLRYGGPVWPGVFASAFVVAFSSAVSPLTAAGQAVGATLGAFSGAWALRRIPQFDPELSRLRDALALIAFGAFGSALISSLIGLFTLYVTGVQAYSGIGRAWLVYWLGDSTGVLLVTPLVFTLPALFRMRSRADFTELVALLTLLMAACLLIFGDLALIPVQLHVLAFAVMPFVMWAAIDFGIGGATLSVFMIATIATLATAFGSGPFAGNSSFVNAVLLDVLFAVLSISGLALAAVIAERERGKSERERLIREQSAMEARLHLAAIVEGSDDAIYSKSVDGAILSWNGAAERIFGFTASEAVGRSSAFMMPPDLRDEEERLTERLKSGDRIERYETIRLTRAGLPVNVSLTVSALSNQDGELLGSAVIARDITEQLRSQEALSTVSRRLIHAQEQERARIARELHDDIGQRLALLALNLAELPSAPSPDPQATRLQQQASQLAGDVQAISHGLHSSKLELLGLAAAARSYCREFAGQQNVVVDFVGGEVPAKLPAGVSLCLFRVLQEALHNSAKHSGVGRFEVKLWESSGEIHLQVSDPGSGFDLDVARRSGNGLGLVSMRERLKLESGDLSIDTKPGHGTRVYARAPVLLPLPSMAE